MLFPPAIACRSPLTLAHALHRLPDGCPFVSRLCHPAERCADPGPPLAPRRVVGGVGERASIIFIIADL